MLALFLGESEASYCPSLGRISWSGDDDWGEGGGDGNGDGDGDDDDDELDVDGGVPPSGEVHQPTALQTDSVATLTQPW